VGIEGAGTAREGEVALFGRAGSRVRLAAAGEATALLLGGEPLGEPVVAYGPFVMSRPEEIHRAIEDYRSGRMGHLP